MKTVLCLLMAFLPAYIHAQSKSWKARDFRRQCREAARGDNDAVRNVISRYMGNGEAGYYDRSMKVLMKAAAQGSPEACYALGNCLFRRSRDSSIMYYTKGEARHDTKYAPLCAFALGDLYARGLPPELMGGVSHMRDTSLAIKWYRKFLGYDIPYVDKVYVTAKVLIYTTGGPAALQYLDSVNNDDDKRLSGLRGLLQSEIKGYR